MINEIKRQISHIIFGIIIILSVLLVSRKIVLISLLSLLLLAVLLSMIHTKKRIPIISFLLEKMGRKIDSRFPGKGFIFFTAGCLLAFKIFPQDIALASIVVLTFGDSVSTLVGSVAYLGRKYNSDPFSRYKAYYGTIIGAIVAFPFAMLFVNPVYAAAAAAAGMIAEAISIKFGEQEADDNLIVPLAAGTACYLLKLAA